MQLRTIIQLIIFFTIFFSANVQSQCPQIIWSDEFDGTAVDQSKWSFQIGNGCEEGPDLCGWGNNELQYYKEENAVVGGGTLKIIAKEETVDDNQYTSARIRTIDKGDFQFGRIEARMKLPVGKGIWPAFWMLPTDEVFGGWPQSGEIDIMEYIGQEPEEIFGTIHFGDPFPNNRFQGNDFLLNDGSSFNEDFHVFAIEWEANEIRWLIDGFEYSKKRPSDIAPDNWPFNERFHMILNMAVGGNLPGPPDGSTVFPQTIEIDYVRVYDEFFPSLTGNTIVSNQAESEVYAIKNLSEDSEISWSVPGDAVITSGAGTNSVTVDFGNESGKVSADITSSCGMETIEAFVEVEAPKLLDLRVENFDNPSFLDFDFSNGTLNENVENPAPNAVNSSELVGEYIRDGSQQFDVLVYNIDFITTGRPFVLGSNAFFMDVLTDAPAGTAILLQLENSSLSMPDNFPTGRHSRYEAITSKENEWEKLQFTFIDQPDAGVPDTNIDQLIFLFASNTQTDNTFYFDNLEVFSENPVNDAPIINIASPGNNLQFEEGSTISILAEAADPDGVITNVEFFANDISIGQDSVAPYEITFIPDSVGSYNLTVVATDDMGKAETSEPIRIIYGEGVITSVTFDDTALFKAFPNPANKKLFVVSNKLRKPTSFRIYDLSGSVVKSMEDVLKQTVEFDIRELKRGIYFIKINNQNYQHTIKFLKK